MPRPLCPRRVGATPPRTYFKPRGVPVSQLEETVLSVDELEALRLADLEGLYQEDAASRMNVSRATFGRIVEAARGKVAQALVQGRALRIEGGVVETTSVRSFACGACGHRWQAPFGTGRPEGCPGCGCGDFQRTDGGRRGRTRRRSAPAGQDGHGRTRRERGGAPKE
jgi:predicted DNA-binding protein (UPF0251 family)